MTLVLMGAACSGGKTRKAGDTGSQAKVAITPAGSVAKIRPDSAIIVQAGGGTIQDVTITTTGTKVQGDGSADGSRWRSRWTLDPGTRYEVAATVLGKDGMTRSATSTFTTEEAQNPVAVTLEAPFQGEKVGVGIPIILSFDREVHHKKEVEKALEVRSSRPVVGAWVWFGDQKAVFRTKEHWPRRTKVEFVGHLSGVQVAPNVFGTKNLHVKSEIGDEHTSVASEDEFRMVVKKNGRTVRTIPISMGKGGVRKYTTTNGNHLTMDKGQRVLMDSSTVGCPPGCPDYYRQDVYWAVRISNSGEYAHSAPWSVGSQGKRNVSHGCVNMSPEDATWFYRFSQRGDPYKIVGSDRELEPDNGWGYWQLSWRDWLKRSILKRPVTTGPIGSGEAPSVVADAPSPSSTPVAMPSGHGTPGTPPR